MKLIDIVRAAGGTRIEDEDGSVEVLTLSAGMSADELEALARELPCPLPDDVRELLAFSRGFENGPMESICFAGLPGGFELDGVFPSPLPIAHDGFGNYWIADLLPESTCWGPIFYACHDPAVVVFQAATLEEFVREFLRFATPPHASTIDDVHDKAAYRIHATNPEARPANQLRDSTDPSLRAFAQSLSDDFFVIDLRSASVGDGFSWGRFGPKTKTIRFNNERLFAYEAKSRWARWLGR